MNCWSTWRRWMPGRRSRWAKSLPFRGRSGGAEQSTEARLIIIILFLSVRSGYDRPC